MVAAFVGDFLFADRAFAVNLFLEHRNVRQKIFDELQYQRKAATGVYYPKGKQTGADLPEAPVQGGMSGNIRC